MDQPSSSQQLQHLQYLEAAREHIRGSRLLLAEINQIIVGTRKMIAQSQSLMAEIDKQSAWLYQAPIE